MFQPYKDGEKCNKQWTPRSWHARESGTIQKLGANKKPRTNEKPSTCIQESGTHQEHVDSSGQRRYN